MPSILTKLYSCFILLHPPSSPFILRWSVHVFHALFFGFLSIRCFYFSCHARTPATQSSFLNSHIVSHHSISTHLSNTSDMFFPYIFVQKICQFYGGGSPYFMWGFFSQEEVYNVFTNLVFNRTQQRWIMRVFFEASTLRRVACEKCVS